MSKLFSEIYGCYFEIVSHVLNRAMDGIQKDEIENIITKYGFSETAFHLLPELIGDEWNFLEKRGDLYYSRLSGQIKRPVTELELSWLAALISDPKIKLFLSGEQLAKLNAALSGITPAFNASDFISTDKHLDGDPYDNSGYIANFRKILSACKTNSPLKITYDSEKTGRHIRTCYPFKLSYSYLNDKFRLLCAVFNTKTQKLNKIIFNLGRIVSAEFSDLEYGVSHEELCGLFVEPNENPPITLEISKERNSLERFLLQFASFDRKTEYDPERDIYTCQISYDLSDETELLIRILSFGPTIKVLGPESFLSQLKERLKKQLQLFGVES